MDNKNTLVQKTGINVNYHCQLMENYVAENNIDLGKDLQAVKINATDALVFFIDEATHRLNVVVMSDSATSTHSHFVTESSVQATAFAVHHDATTQTFRIAYAAQRNGNSELMVSNPIAIAALDLDRWNITYSWSAKQLQQKQRVINYITMDEHLVLFSTIAPKSDADFYSFVHGEQPKFYTLPENGCQVQQIKVGKWAGQSGVFLLYTVGTNKTLLFRGLYVQEGEVLQERFSTGKKINAFDLLRDEYDNSVVYTSGEGIGRFAGSDEDTGTMLVKATPGIEFFKIDVSNHEEEVSVWTIGKTNDGNSGLYYMTNKWHNQNNINSEIRWTNPLPMQHHIEEFASIKGEQLTNQLYLFGKKDENAAPSLIHFWQDSSTNWTEHTVSVENLENSKKLDSYTIDINFSGQETNNTDLMAKKVSLWVEENTLLYINNQKRFLQPQKPFEVALDELHNINIIYPTDSLSANSVFISADFLDTTIEINPTHGITEAMSEKIKNTDDLLNAQTQTGQPLLKQRLSQQELEQITQGIASLKTASNDLKNNSKPQARGNAAPLVTMYVENQPQGLRAASEGGGVSGVFSWVGNAVGDLWHGVKKGFQTMTSWVVSSVKGVWKFVIKIGEMIIDFVVDTVKKVVNVLQKIFESIKTFFKDLFEFLAFLFKWEDILVTKNTVKAYMRNAFVAAQGKIDDCQTYVNQKLNNIKDSIDLQIEMEKMPNDTLKTPENKTDIRIGWINSKSAYIKQAKETGETKVNPELQAKIINVSQTLEAYFKKYGTLLNEIFSNIGDKFKQLMQGQYSIKDFLNFMVLGLARLGLEVGQDLINFIFEAIKSTLRFIDDTLNQEIKIPFISDLYRSISGDSALSILDVVCLLVSIPATIAYKLGEGIAPFKNENKQEFIASGLHIFDII